MEFAAESAEFNHVLLYIGRLTGIELPESNHRLVRRFLNERLEVFGCGPDEYLARLEGDDSERSGFLDAVTINETYFFREQRHFSLLADEILPSLCNGGNAVLRLWSAACSTGEEAVSLAVLAAEGWWNDDFEVYGSDINPLAIEVFSGGVYRNNSFRDDGHRFHEILRKYLLPAGGGYRLSERLAGHLFPAVQNLASPVYSEIPEPVDIIFLRNILIYINDETRLRILDRVVDKLSPGGYLFLSSSEIVLLAHPELSLENRNGTYFFRKKTRSEKAAGVFAGSDVTVVKPETENGNRPAEKHFPKSGVELREVLEHIFMRLNNPLYERSGSEAFRAALEYLETVYYLNSGRLKKAAISAEKLVSFWGENEITAYILGVKALQEGDSKEAELRFRKALEKDAGFWPALYQRALIEKDRHPRRAGHDFRECLRYIRAYIESGSYIYQFLLEGFNAKYFAGICRGWITKLDLKGAANES